MRAPLLALVVVGALACAAIGCDGESSFLIPLVDAGVPDARYQAACAVWAQGLCNRAVACSALFDWTDIEQCVQRSALRCELFANDPDIPFDAASVSSCPEPDGGDCTAPYGSLCLAPGRAPLGASCAWNEECQSYNCLFLLDSTGEFSACGTCQPGCGASCPDGQTCDFSGDAGPLCVPIAGDGESCVDGAVCSGFFYCNSSGTCALDAKAGEACGDGVSGPPCGGGNLYCDETRHCSSYQSAAYGQSCGVVGSEAYVCTGFGMCDSTENLCLPPASDGAVCDETQGLGCLPPARCVSNTCVFPSLARCLASADDM
jgi:hypothetical protein